MHPALILLMGAVMCGGLYWQYRLFVDNPGAGLERLRISLAFSTLYFVGVSTYSILSLIDDQKEWTHGDAVSEVLRSLLFAGLLNLKCFFGPLVAASAGTVLLYYWFSYGESPTVGLVSSTVGYLFERQGKAVESLYLLFTLVYSAGTSLWGEDAESFP